MHRPGATRDTREVASRGAVLMGHNLFWSRPPLTRTPQALHLDRPIYITRSSWKDARVLMCSEPWKRCKEMAVFHCANIHTVTKIVNGNLLHQKYNRGDKIQFTDSQD